MFGPASFRRCVVLSVAMAAALGSDSEARAAVMIGALNSPSTENFNAFDGSAGTIPANFTWSPDPGTTAGGIADSAGTYSTNNRWYALIHTPTTGANERAFGTKRQPNPTPDILTWSFVNSTGTNITSFDVTWDVEQYARGNRNTAIDLDYNPNGAGPTQVGIVGASITFATIGSTGGEYLASPIITSRSVAIALATPLADGQSIDFRWSTISGLPSNGNAHIGIDNLSVTAQGIPEAAAVWFGGLACAATGLIRLVGRRRERASL